MSKIISKNYENLHLVCALPRYFPSDWRLFLEGRIHIPHLVCDVRFAGVYYPEKNSTIGRALPYRLTQCALVILEIRTFYESCTSDYSRRCNDASSRDSINWIFQSLGTGPYQFTHILEEVGDYRGDLASQLGGRLFDYRSTGRVNNRKSTYTSLVLSSSNVAVHL